MYFEDNTITILPINYDVISLTSPPHMYVNSIKQYIYYTLQKAIKLGLKRVKLKFKGVGPGRQVKCSHVPLLVAGVTTSQCPCCAVFN